MFYCSKCPKKFRGALRKYFLCKNNFLEGREFFSFERSNSCVLGVWDSKKCPILMISFQLQQTSTTSRYGFDSQPALPRDLPDATWLNFATSVTLREQQCRLRSQSAQGSKKIFVSQQTHSWKLRECVKKTLNMRCNHKRTLNAKKSELFDMALNKWSRISFDSSF